MRPPPRSSSSKKIPSNTTQRHKYLKTILFFSTYNNLKAKGKKQSSYINCSLSATGANMRYYHEGSGTPVGAGSKFPLLASAPT
jgi:hypothetical protein